MPEPAVAPRSAHGRFAHIDALRAFAVMVVVVAHAGLGDVVPGGSGVTIFFSISGFIITYVVLRERERVGGFDVPGFYLRRFLKILPPLTVTVLIPTAIYALFRRVDLEGVLSQIFFFYNWTVVHGPSAVLPGSRVLWSLAIEEQFYVVFAVLWLLAIRTRRAEPLLGLAALAVVVYSIVAKLVLADGGTGEHRIYYGSDTRIDAIALGTLSALVFVRWQRAKGAPGLARRLVSHDLALPAAMLLYVLTLVYRDPSFRSTARFPLQAVAACVVILYGFLSERGPAARAFFRGAGWRPVQVVGLASYSIYLVHFSIALALAPALGGSRAVRVTVITLLSVAAGWLVYRVVEIPCARLRSRLHDVRDPGRAMTEAPAPG